MFKRILGSGGTGTVYLADDLLLVRQVAVKTILPALTDDHEIRQRIDRECRLHAAIGVHPHIVALYDRLEEDGRIYLVMEYVRGDILSRLLQGQPGREGQRWSTGDALLLIQQILEAIGCIHDHGILHRDIKASNILVMQQPGSPALAKLMDFGIARMEENSDMQTRLTMVDASGPGTPTYMAPERIDPGRYGESCPATDLYSAGVILYQLLGDGPPFTGTISEIFNGHLNQPVAMDRLRSGIPDGLKEIIKKSLAKNPNERFQDARSFLAALQNFSRRGATMEAANRGADEPTLMVVEPDQAPSDATLLAPTSCRLDTEADNRNISRSILVVAGVSLVTVFFLGIYFVFVHGREPGSTPAVSPGTASREPVTEARKKPAPPATPVGHPATANQRSSALEAFQTLRNPPRARMDGMVVKERDGTGQLSEQSDWQVIESSATRIKK